MLSKAYQKFLRSRPSFFRQQLNGWLATIDVRRKECWMLEGGANPVKNKVRSWNVKKYVILDNALETQKTKAHIVADLNLALHPADSPDVACRVGAFDVAFCLEVMEYIWNPVVALANLKLVSP